MIVAVTSRVSALSSMRTPISAGRSCRPFFFSGGGSYSVSTASRANSGLGFASAFSPSFRYQTSPYQRSRPCIHHCRPTAARPTKNAASAAPTVHGVMSNASSISCSASGSTGSRSGGATSTTPFSMPTTIVIPDSLGSSRVVENVALEVVKSVSQPSLEPVLPWKHSTAYTPLSDKATLADAVSIGTGHSLPVTFQKNSSWSGKALRAPASR